MRGRPGCACAFVVLMLSGCGGSSFHGTLPGPGTGPQPASGQPVVSGVSPSTVAAGGPGFTVTVTGKNFAQGDTVEWNDLPLVSVFVSSTQMTAQVPNQLLYGAGQATLIVQPPTPYPINFGSVLTVTAAPAPGTAGFTMSQVGVQANDMVWDAQSGQLYLSVAGTDVSYANSIAALDPATGKIGAAVSAGADHLAVSKDGAWLYAGIDKNAAIQRFAVPSLASDISIPLGKDASGLPYYAIAMEAANTSANTIAVSEATSVTVGGPLVIFDGATPRAGTIPSVGGYPNPLIALAWNASDTALYGTFSMQYSEPAVELAVSAAGVTLGQESTGVSSGGVHYSGTTGYVYTAGGQVLDPSSMKAVNQLPLNASGAFYGATLELLAVDDGLGIAYVLGQGTSAGQYVIEAFDVKACALLGSIEFSGIADTPVKMVRWGSDGLAILTQGPNGPQAGDGVYLLSGAFVTNPTVQMRGAGGGSR